MQNPYTLAGGIAPCSADEAWWVPLPFITSAAPARLQWAELSGCQSAAPLATLPANASGAAAAAWVKLNAQQYSFVRVQYSEPMWAALAAAARQTSSSSGGGGGGEAAVLSGVDLAGLLEDSYSLAEAGELGITPFLSLVAALGGRSPQEFEPWAVALPYLYKVNRLLVSGACGVAWRRFLTDRLLGPFLGGPAAAAGSTGNSSSKVPPAPALMTFSFLGNGSAAVPEAEQGVG